MELNSASVFTPASHRREHARNVQSFVTDLQLARAVAQTVPVAPADSTWSVAGFGVDTVSFAWRDFDYEAAMARLASGFVTSTGEVRRAQRKGPSAWFTDDASGARVGVTRSPLGASLLWCEGRLSALCSGDATDHSLGAPELLTDGAGAALRLAQQLGLPPREGAAVLLRRVDPAADVEFARPTDGLAFLQALAHLDCPGYKRNPTYAKGSSDVEGVEWRTPKSYRVVHRAYDKGRESETREPGRLVRLERQWWVPSSERAAPDEFLATNLPRRFAGPLRGWVEPGVNVVAVGPADAYELLQARLGKALGRSGGVLTLRVAERMAGTIGVLSVCGDGWFDNARTAQRRRAELREVGIEFISSLPSGRRIDVGAVLVAACAAWS